MPEVAPRVRLFVFLAPLPCASYGTLSSIRGGPPHQDARRPEQKLLNASDWPLRQGGAWARGPFYSLWHPQSELQLLAAGTLTHARVPGWSQRSKTVTPHHFPPSPATTQSHRAHPSAGVGFPPRGPSRASNGLVDRSPPLTPASRKSLANLSSVLDVKQRMNPSASFGCGGSARDSSL